MSRASGVNTVFSEASNARLSDAPNMRNVVSLTSTTRTSPMHRSTSSGRWAK
jgi:hypothetical protein